MNSGSFALEPISQDQVLVTVALALVAILAVLTIIAMVWGARLKRRRTEAEKVEQRRIDELKAEGVEVSNTAEGGTPVERVQEAHGGAAADRTAEPQPASPLPSAAPSPAPSPVPTLSPAPTPSSAATSAPVPTPAPVPIPTPVSKPAPASASFAEPDVAATSRPLADEPIAAAAPLDASPASVAADAPDASPSDDPGAQSVTMLKGLGPKIAARLGELGITRVDQLAWLDDGEAGELDRRLGAFEGRMERDRWREQARLLAQGDRAGYEAQFGKLG